MSATIFPPLSSVGGFITQNVLTTLAVDEQSSKTYKSYVNKMSEKKQFSQQGFSPTDESKLKIEIIDTAKYRNTFYHNLCLDMLKEGYHQAFSEIFNLVLKEKEASKEEDHLELDKLPIDEDEQKLLFLKEMLVTAEKAKRQGRSEEIYESQLLLAQYFDDVGDYRLADHMHNSAFLTSSQIRGDGRRKEAEACCNLGHSAERKENFIAAKKYYEDFHSLTYGKDFQLEDGTTLHQIACDCLQRIYIALAEQLPVEQKDEILQLLEKAYDIAKEGGSVHEVGKVGYLIGNKYSENGNQELALKYHNEFYEIAKSSNDDIGMAKACQAIANAKQRQGNMEEAIDQLKQFLQLSEKSNDMDSRREACRDLGRLYNFMGKYEQSSNYLKKAFELTQKEEFNNLHSSSSRCEYAISLAHGLLTGAVENLSRCEKKNLGNLLYWKSERVQGFSTDQQTYQMYETIDHKLNAIKVTEERRNSRRATLKEAEVLKKETENLKIGK